MHSCYICLAANDWSFFTGPESDHWQPLSLNDSVPDSRLVDLIDVTLACGDANSIFVEVITVANVDDEDHVGNSFFCRFGS